MWLDWEDLRGSELLTALIIFDTRAAGPPLDLSKEQSFASQHHAYYVTTAIVAFIQLIYYYQPKRKIIIISWLNFPLLSIVIQVPDQG